MRKCIGVVWLALAAPMALASDTEVAEKAQATEQADDEAAAGTKEKEFKPPAGFVTKKRGALTLYCMKDRTTGTRFATEKCYDQNQIRDYLLALEVQKRDVDRIRATCASASVCANQ